MQIKPTIKEILYGAGIIFAVGGAWGTLAYRVNAQEAVVKTVPEIATKVSVLEAKQEYLINLVEYSIGLRASLPKRPAQQGR